MKQRHPEKPLATTVMSHGMNPGLVSHFVMHGLVDIAAKVLKEALLQAAWMSSAFTLTAETQRSPLPRDTECTEVARLCELVATSWTEDYPHQVHITL